MKAKLVDGKLSCAPSVAIYEGKRYRPVPDDILTKMGYKDVRYTSAPETENDYHAESYWTESSNEIVQSWRTVEDSNATKAENRRVWFDNSYRKFNEMLTRHQALGITEEITDEFRDKTYTSLTDLYTEAEVVRAEINAMENQNE